MEEKEGGLLLIDKPYEWSSFDVVKKLRNVSKVKKIGHAGTLDPLATGLLILCYGKFTKRIEEIQNLQKVYTGTFVLGATTPSFDKETAINEEFPIDHITEEQLLAAAEELSGEIEQTPPVFSAVKVKGKRAYEFARSGEEVKLKSRTVMIHSFKLTRIELPEVDFEIVCSKGTYIRSMARDFGAVLQSGAYLSALRRTAIGPYSVENALPPLAISSDNEFYLHSIR